MPCFTAIGGFPQEVEEFCIKVLDVAGKHHTNASHDDKILSFKITDKFVFPEFEAPANKTLLKTGTPEKKKEEKKEKEKEKPLNAKDIVTYHVYSDGKIEKHIPKEIKEGYEKKYKYVYHDNENKEHEICIAEKVNAQNWIKGSQTDGGNGWQKRIVDNKTRYYKKGEGENELIKVPFPINYKKEDVIIKLIDNTSREYINPKAFASIIGALAECNYEDVTLNGFTSKDGTGAPSVSHVNGLAGDLRYLRKDKSGAALNIFTSPNLLDIIRQEKIIDALVKFGYSSFLSYNITIDNKPFILKNCTHLTHHDDHLHLNKAQYNPNYKEIKE